VPALTAGQIEYLRSQPLARLATADAAGSPHVVPVRFSVSADGRFIETGGRQFGTTKKYRDIRSNPRVAIVVDDIASVNPWSPRGIEVRGTAELQDPGDSATGGDQPWVRIAPERVVSWGIEETSS
jgi:pyridoxamine 5'-phosphate oxidase family protein